MELGSTQGETTPWARTVSTCGQLLKQKEALWPFWEIQGIEPTNNAAERALRQALELAHERNEQTPLSQTVQVCQDLLKRQQALWTVLDHDDVEPINNGGERVLRPAVI